MGISSIISSAYKAMPSIKTVKRALKTVPDIIFDKGADTFVRGTADSFKAAMKNGGSIKKSLWQSIKEGGGKLALDVAKNTRANGSIWSRMWSSLKSTPSVIKASVKDGAAVAKAAGKSSIWGGTKGFFNGIGKRMPLIGNLILIASELPNVIKATKEQGIGQGIAEVAKSGSRLVGGSIGAAIGSMVFPGVGSIVGWMVGDWLTSKVVGKSYTEKQDEIAQKQQEALETLQQMGIDPQAVIAQQQGMTNPVQQPQTVPFGANPFVPYPTSPDDMLGGNLYNSQYANDIMMQGMKFNTIV